MICYSIQFEQKQTDFRVHSDLLRYLHFAALVQPSLLMNISGQRVEIRHFHNAEKISSLFYLTNFCNVSMLHNNRRKLENFLLFLCSPSGAVLNKIEQIKEYLLSHGTCKCGLPCPLRPDCFFEFNPHVSNPISIIIKSSEF